MKFKISVCSTTVIELEPIYFTEGIMKRTFVGLLLLLPLACYEGAMAGFFDDLGKNLGIPGQGTDLDDGTIGNGLKEAIATATSRAVTTVSGPNGYLGNPLIKILIPDQIRSAADLLAKFGFQQEVDGFVASMNHAAEKAAPKATGFFMEALKAMTFDDARKILNGSPTAATEYFRQKTGDKIYAAFEPVVVSSMQEVGVARSYKQVVSKLDSIPFAGSPGSLDLDRYVTTKAMDGLFVMIGEEEKKIRTNPAARGTELLKKVFGR